MLKRIIGALVAIAFAWSVAIPVPAQAAISTFADNVEMSVLGAPGTGSITLNAATADHQSFAAAGIPNDALVCVFIQDTGNAWEIDYQDTYDLSAGTLTREFQSSSTGSVLSLDEAAVVAIVACSSDLTALVNAIVPSGMVAMFDLASCPTGWVAADGTNSTADARGNVLRGLDNGAGRDPTGSALGELEADAVETIEATASSSASTSVSVPTHTGGTASAADVAEGTSAISGGSEAASASTSVSTTVSLSGPTFDTETRMKNVVLLACQKS